MVRRIPHGFEVEHVHGGTVDTRGLDDADRKTLADHARRTFGAFAARQRSQDAGTGFVSPGDRDGKPVEQQKAALLLQRSIVRGPFG